MNIIEKVLIAAMLIAPIQITSIADEVSFNATTVKENISESEFSEMCDYGNVNVSVYENSDGESTLIYEGLLSGYDEGAWTDVDFGKTDILVILDWQTGNSIWIEPIRTLEQIANVEETQFEDRLQTVDLLSDNSSLSISSQIKINGINVGETGIRIIDKANLNCNFSVSNDSLFSQSLTVILATYTEDGDLYQVKTAGININPGEIDNIQMVYQFNAENEQNGKIMFWNSLAGALPIRTSVNFSQESGINAYYYDADNKLLQIDKSNNNSIYFTYDRMGNLLSKTTRKETDDE